MKLFRRKPIILNLFGKKIEVKPDVIQSSQGLPPKQLLKAIKRARRLGIFDIEPNEKCSYLLPLTPEAQKELEKKGCPFCKWLKETKQK